MERPRLLLEALLTRPHGERLRPGKKRLASAGITAAVALGVLMGTVGTAEADTRGPRFNSWAECQAEADRRNQMGDYPYSYCFADVQGYVWLWHR